LVELLKIRGKATMWYGHRFKHHNVVHSLSPHYGNGQLDLWSPSGSREWLSNISIALSCVTVNLDITGSLFAFLMHALYYVFPRPLMYISFLHNVEDEEREKLAKEISKDWSTGIYFGAFHFQFDYPVLYDVTKSP
jgi:hypothetical protein